MNIFKSLLVVLTCTLLCNSLQAQNALFNYVITVNNDTIKCEFEKTLFTQLKYQPVTSPDKFIKIKPEEIKKYFIAKDSVTYASVTLPDSQSPEFLPQIEQGKINLYKEIITQYTTMPYSTITTEYWFVNKDNGPLIQLKSNTIFNKGSQSKRKNIFIEMIADDAALSEEYKKEDSSV
jgi:hypothetical protein